MLFLVFRIICYSSFHLQIDSLGASSAVGFTVISEGRVPYSCNKFLEGVLILVIKIESTCSSLALE